MNNTESLIGLECVLNEKIIEEYINRVDVVVSVRNWLKDHRRYYGRTFKILDCVDTDTIYHPFLVLGQEWIIIGLLDGSRMSIDCNITTDLLILNMRMSLKHFSKSNYLAFDRKINGNKSIIR